MWLATGNLLTWFTIMGGSFSIVLSQNLAVTHAQEDAIEFRKLVGSGFILYFLLAAIILFGVWISADWFLSWFSYNPVHQRTIKLALYLATLSASIAVFISPLLHVLGAWMQNGPVLRATLVGGAVGIGMNVLLLILGFGLLSIPFAMLSKTIGMLLFLAPATIREWRRRKVGKPLYDWQHTQRLTKRSGPLLISNLASIGLHHSQATIIGLLFSPGAATTVSITDKLFSLVKSFVFPVGNALLQPLSSILHIPEKFDRISNQFMRQIDLVSMAAILFCLAINQTFISIWVGPSYYGGMLLSIALALSTYSIIRVNLKVAVLNAKGFFSITSGYAILDLILRIVFLTGFYYTLKFYHISILPLAESLGILLASYFIFSKQVNFPGIPQRTVILVFCGLMGIGFLQVYWTQGEKYFYLLFILGTLGMLGILSIQIIKTKLLHELYGSFRTMRSEYASP